MNNELLDFINNKVSANGNCYFYNYTDEFCTLNFTVNEFIELRRKNPNIFIRIPSLDITIGDDVQVDKNGDVIHFTVVRSCGIELIKVVIP